VLKNSPPAAGTDKLKHVSHACSSTHEPRGLSFSLTSEFFRTGYGLTARGGMLRLPGCSARGRSGAATG